MPSNAHEAVAARLAEVLTTPEKTWAVPANIFYGEVVEVAEGAAPSVAIFVGFPEPEEPLRYQGSGRDNPVSLEVWVRGEPEDRAASRALAVQCMEALERATLPGFYWCGVDDTEPEYMGEDDGRCPAWAFTLELRYTSP